MSEMSDRKIRAQFPKESDEPTDASNLSEASSFETALRRLRSRLTIQVDQLEVECSDQAMLFEEAARIKAEIRSSQQRCVLRRDQNRANLGSQIRKNPGEFGIEKITEKAIEEAITNAPESRQIEDELLEIGRNLGLIGAIASSLEQRRTMVSDCVDLYVHDYYTEGLDKKNAQFTEDQRQETIERIKQRRRDGLDDSAEERAGADSK